MLGKYGLPLVVKYCNHCTRSNQRPHNIGEFKQSKKGKKKFVDFDEKGICKACQYYFYKNKINWEKREKELRKLCDRFRKNNGKYDVIVPGSGGKDSIYVAHQLKHFYGMKPILVTWAPNIYTEIGKKNFDAWLSMGMPNITYNHNHKVHRVLTKLAFLNLVHPFQPFIIGQKNFAPKIAANLNIKLVMFGESDAEFGMMMDKKDNPKMDMSYFTSDENPEELFISGIKVKNLMKQYKFSKNDLEPYLPLRSSE